jgi:hypothetical protein
MKRTISTLSPILLTVFALLGVLALLLGAVSAQTGSNWTANFFNCTDFNCAVAASVNYPSGVNFNWGTGGPRDAVGNPIAGVGATDFTARFVTVENFEAGNYEFIVTFDDGVRLFVDNILYINNFQANELSTITVTVPLTAGTHTVTVEYVQFGGGSVIQARWNLIGTGIGTGTFGPTLTAVPAFTVEVVGVQGLAVRTGPYLGASLITVARPGIWYTVEARNQSEGFYTWYRIRIYDRGGGVITGTATATPPGWNTGNDTRTQTGWVSGRFLRGSGNEDAVPFSGSVFDEIDDAPFRGMVGIPRANMNIRVRPSVRTAIVGQVPWGEPVEVIGRTVQAGVNQWLHIRYQGQLGWIAAAWVTLDDDGLGYLQAVPIR